MTDPEKAFIAAAEAAVARGNQGRGFVQVLKDPSSGEEIRAWSFSRVEGREFVDGTKKEQTIFTWFLTEQVDFYAVARTEFYEWVGSVHKGYWDILGSDHDRVRVDRLGLSALVGQKGAPFSEAKASIERLNY